MSTEDAQTARDQDINPWSVEGARDEQGNAVSIDYQAICRYVVSLPYPGQPNTSIR